MTALMLAIMRKEPAAPSTLDPKLSKAWDAVIAKALAEKADDRYQTAKEFAQAVRDTGGVETGSAESKDEPAFSLLGQRTQPS